VTVLWLFRWLAFRVEFGAGLIKIRGDRCWRDLTCLNYHHETQPLPGPVSWYFHRLPQRVHRMETAANHVTQLVVPFGLFAPQPVAGICAAIIIVTQLWLFVSGNFAWLNLLTMIVAAAALSGGFLGGAGRLATGGSPLWFVVLVLLVTALVAVLSYWPARNLLSARQLMNTRFNPLHLVNAYGAFGSVTRVRDEVVIEGTDAEAPAEAADWREYEFKGKPGDPCRRPPQVAPYHLRLDWLMWFLPLGSPAMHAWFPVLLRRLLAADRAALRLLRRDPFDGTPPAYVRARLYRYRYTSWAERRRTGAWWDRRLIGEYAPPVSLPERTATRDLR
jgi:hypothetical protein